MSQKKKWSSIMENWKFLLKNKLRRCIFPCRETINLLIEKCDKNKSLKVLDVGGGNGWFLKDFLFALPCKSDGIVIEIDERYFSKFNFNNGSTITIGNNELLKNEKFDIILFNDVLHHIENKNLFIKNYLSYLIETGFVFIKEMSSDNIIYRNWNRLHDYILTRQIISEISCDEIEEILDDDFVLIEKGCKTIFLYDHFWCLFQKKGYEMLLKNKRND